MIQLWETDGGGKSAVSRVIVLLFIVENFDEDYICSFRCYSPGLSSYLASFCSHRSSRLCLSLLWVKMLLLLSSSFSDTVSLREFVVPLLDTKVGLSAAGDEVS